MMEESLQVAAPWGLSHYIPLNGFHPLYRALFDPGHAEIKINSWANVRLNEQISEDEDLLSRILERSRGLENLSISVTGARLEPEYKKFFWAPNHLLTAELPGNLEFHHTAPFPSFTRPFVFHCESFAPIFFPFWEQGGGEIRNPELLREHYGAIFSHPLCLGIFSHIEETLQSIRKFFNDPVINQKLHLSRIGLSSRLVSSGVLKEDPNLDIPRFLFINSAHQNPENFFKRGGHVVLQFWKKFLQNGRNGKILMRCQRPSSEELESHGVDHAFVDRESGRSIVWIQEYLAWDELHSLLQWANFFLLPSLSLHSVSIMQSMANGVVPVVTDTIGTERYVSDGETGIILSGMRAALWSRDPATGVLIDQYSDISEVDSSLVDQMFMRIDELLNHEGDYFRLRTRVYEHAKKEFSGSEFSKDFWGKVSSLYREYSEKTISVPDSGKNSIGSLLSESLMQEDGLKKAFESPTQPMRRFVSWKSVIWEMSGFFVMARDEITHMSINDWSVLSHHYNPDSPRLYFAPSIIQFNGEFMIPDEKDVRYRVRELIMAVSRMLLPYPGIHKRAKRIYKGIRVFFLAMKGKYQYYFGHGFVVFVSRSLSHFPFLHKPISRLYKFGRSMISPGWRNG